MIINVILNNGKRLELDVNEGMSAEEILCSLNEELPYRVLLCKVDNNYRSLTHKIDSECTVEYLDMRNNEAWLVYQSSLVFLYNKAVRDVLGNDIQLDVWNSLNKGLYTTMNTIVNKDTVAMIESRMKELVEDMLSSGVAKDINIYIGEETEKEELKNFSIVTFNHLLEDKDIGTIGIIGPTRMDYSKVISVMKYISKKLNDDFKKGKF